MPASGVWELAQLLKSQDSLGLTQEGGRGGGGGAPPTAPTEIKRKELILLTAGCFLSGSLSGEEKRLPTVGPSGGQRGPGRTPFTAALQRAANDAGGTKLPLDPVKISSVERLQSTLVAPTSCLFMSKYVNIHAYRLFL